MNNLASSSPTVKPGDDLSEIIATINAFGADFRFLVAHQTDRGRIVIRASQANTILLDYFPTRLPALGLVPLAIARFDRAAQTWQPTADAAKVQDWLDEAGELLEPKAGITPTHPADLIGEEIKTAHPELASRVDKALALIKSGERVKNEHNLRYYPHGGGLWACDCPDSQFRSPRAEWGTACYHGIAGEIKRRLVMEQEQVAHRRLADKTERRRQSAPATALPASVDNIGRLSDYLDSADESTPAAPLPTISPAAAAAMAARLDRAEAKSAANARAQAAAMKPGGHAASYEFRVKRGRS